MQAAQPGGYSQVPYSKATRPRARARRSQRLVQHIQVKVDIDHFRDCRKIFERLADHGIYTPGSYVLGGHKGNTSRPGNFEIHLQLQNEWAPIWTM